MQNSRIQFKHQSFTYKTFPINIFKSIQPQITQERIKSHQRSNCLVFLSF